MKNLIKFSAVIFIFLAAQVIAAQTTEFSYQGKLTDTGTEATGVFQMEFKLFGSAGGANQIGNTVTNSSVTVTNGVFSVQLDFGATAFDGAERYLEIAVKRNAGDPFTVLAPRQKINSAPYSIKSKSSDTAVNAAQLGGIDANQYVTTTTVGNSFINNATTQQTADFNITGTGTVGGLLSVGGAGLFTNAINGNIGEVITVGGKIGMGSNSPVAKLFINGGPVWTTAGWLASMELSNATAIGWRRNAGNQSFGIGQSSGGLYFFRSPNNPGIPAGAATYDMIITDTGNVGIGTLTPTSKVEIAAQDGLGIRGFQPFLNLVDTSTVSFLRPPLRRLQTVNGNMVFLRRPGCVLLDPNVCPQFSIDMMLTDTGNFGIGVINPTQRLEVAGTTKTSVLQITGGSDLAESFEITDKEIKPGMVVAIDPNNPGKLVLARGAYNRQVAGIISGANNLSAGMLLPDLKESERSMPVALSGRVWVYADATKNPITPGDLLTTSDTPGFAMKVLKHKKAQGAIIGKALTELKSGTGLVLVLVSLQ